MAKNCLLNWATSERLTAAKVRVIKYNHALKSLQQELMNVLTNQGVLMTSKFKVSVPVSCKESKEREVNLSTYLPNMR